MCCLLHLLVHPTAPPACLAVSPTACRTALLHRTAMPAPAFFSARPTGLQPHVHAHFATALETITSASQLGTAIQTLSLCVRPLMIAGLTPLAPPQESGGGSGGGGAVLGAAVAAAPEPPPPASEEQRATAAQALASGVQPDAGSLPCLLAFDFGCYRDWRQYTGTGGTACSTALRRCSQQSSTACLLCLLVVDRHCFESGRGTCPQVVPIALCFCISQCLPLPWHPFAIHPQNSY